MRVLNLSQQDIAEQFKGAEIHTEPDGGQYDEIYTYRNLSEEFVSDGRKVIEEWAGLLATGGAVHICEPSAEWFAREALGGRLGMPAQVQIFGYQRRRKSVYTLEMLRDLLTLGGLTPRFAETRSYVVAQGETDTHRADEHYLVGVKSSGESKGWVGSEGYADYEGA